MIVPADPFSNFKTNFNNTNAAATNAINNTASEIQQQTAPVTKSFDKKNAAIIGGVAALAIAGIGAAVMIKKGKMPDEVKEAFIAANKLNDEATSLAQSVQKQADEILETAQKKFDEVTELFKKGEEKAADGTVLRKITKESDTQSVMEEFADGKLTRKTFFKEGEAQDIRENIEQFADGSEKVAKCFKFDNGKISEYSENIEQFADGSKKAAKALYFDNGKISGYAENVEEFTDGSAKAAKALYFDNGKILEYVENVEEFTDGSAKAAKVLDFDNGKMSYYAENYENTDDFIVTAKDLYFDNGKPRRLVINNDLGFASREYKKEGLGWKKTDYDDYDDFDDFNDDWFDDENPAG
ncbi:TPA: hypothetical protein IAA68_09100 [Candidatus Galligastranaerophilus faecipullorum]|nr:hypothetical protein [Candidatus Galligastranaerophilus faecipullorum]